jgi:methylglutaconyl-CoA hydratase
MDLDELQSLAKQTLAKNLEQARRLSKFFYRLYSFPKPIIAAVNGAAIAGGCGIATLADFTLAAPEAKFGYTEVKIGFMPALVSVFLRRQVGQKHARDLLLSGRTFDAAEAFRLGLVTEIVPAELLMARAREIASGILAASPTAVARTKKFLLRFDDAAVRAELEAAAEANAEIRSTADFREGLAAFLEKRAPNWTGE